MEFETESNAEWIGVNNLNEDTLLSIIITSLNEFLLNESHEYDELLNRNPELYKIINANYPELFNIFKNKNMMINPDLKVVKGIIKGLRRFNNFCPCRVDKTDEDNLCMCKDARENNNCCCKIFILKESN